MKLASLVIALGACGSVAPPPAAPIGNAPPNEPVAKAPKPAEPVACSKIARPPSLTAEAKTKTKAGVLAGAVCDKATGEPLPGTTIVISSPVSGETTAITDEEGRFVFDNVRVGTYEMTIYYADLSARTTRPVSLGEVTWVGLPLDQNSHGEVIEIK